MTMQKSVDLIYEWQQQAMAYFAKHRQAVFVVATGAGKTACTIFIIKEMLEQRPNLNVLIVVPKNVILEKTWFEEMYSFGIPLNKIGVYYGFAKEYAQITLTNMQNIQNIKLEWFQMVVYDEVHNYTTERMLSYLDFPCEYKLGLSATLDYQDPRTWQMLKHFGYNNFDYTPLQALNDNILNRFDFTDVGICLDIETRRQYDVLSQTIAQLMKSKRGRGFKGNSPTMLALLKAMNERKQLIYNYPVKFDAVKDICLKTKGCKTLVFNEYNSSTNALYWHLLEVGIRARIIHSGIIDKEVVQTLMDFKNDRFDVLLTTRMLDEGYNLPRIDTAIIMAGNSTDKQTVQRMGRVLRKKDTKSSLYQIYCIETMESKSALNRSNLFKRLCDNYTATTYGAIQTSDRPGSDPEGGHDGVQAHMG